MQKNTRVYTDPDNSVQFTRYGEVGDAICAALTGAGVFAPQKPRIKMFIGQGWSMHIRGSWGRIVVTGDIETLAEVKAFVEKETDNGRDR